ALATLLSAVGAWPLWAVTQVRDHARRAIVRMLDYRGLDRGQGPDPSPDPSLKPNPELRPLSVFERETERARGDGLRHEPGVEPGSSRGSSQGSSQGSR